MERSLGGSLLRGANRLLGTLLGCVWYWLTIGLAYGVNGASWDNKAPK